MEFRGICKEEEEEEGMNLGVLMGWRFWLRIGICCEGGFCLRFVFDFADGEGRVGRLRCSSVRSGFLWGRRIGGVWGRCWERREGWGMLISETLVVMGKKGRRFGFPSDEA